MGESGRAGVKHSPLLPAVLALLALSCLMALALACESTLSSPEAKAARQATSAPLSAATPWPAPLSIEKPKPATGLRIVELDPTFRPVYVDGLEYAAIGRDDQLYLVNVETGEASQVVNDEHPKYEAAFSAHYAAWTDRRREIELPSVDSNSPFSYSDDIFVLDRATGEQWRITEETARRNGLETSGDWLVWQDSRNDTGQHYTSDIYAHSLRTGREIPVAVAPGSQRSPAIDGDTVVWADNRNSPAIGTAKAGCGNCPENRFDIYAMDLSTGEQRVLFENGHLNQAPDINGSYLAWQSFDSERPAEVRLLDLESGRVQIIAQDEDFHLRPSLSDQYLVWSTSGACDMMTEGDFDITGVFAMHLGTRDTWKLTDYVQPIAAVSGNMVVINEYCWGGGPVYALFLD